MTKTGEFQAPHRVTDLIELKRTGSTVTCNTSFEIVPVDFRHQATPFRAYIFLCRFHGTVDGREYTFRKCYARGCPHNLCPHVAQAVMVANRYLQRDYHRLREAGLEVDTGRLFRLEEMLVKFEDAKEADGPVMVIHDFLNMAKDQKKEVNVVVETELVPAAEHFAHQTTATVFLMVRFHVTCDGREHLVERCLACYPQTEEEEEEKPKAVEIANERLRVLYRDFDEAGIAYTPVFFA